MAASGISQHLLTEFIGLAEPDSGCIITLVERAGEVPNWKLDFASSIRRLSPLLPKSVDVKNCEAH